MKKTTYVCGTIVAFLIVVFSIFMFFQCGSNVGLIATLSVLFISSISFYAGYNEGEKNTENKNGKERWYRFLSSLSKII